jgi:hypothetical protein
MVKSLPTDDRIRNGLTFRQRLEQHRQKAECASCHARLDPLGFGLENFDVLGRWRRGVEYYDAKTVKQIMAELEAKDYRGAALVAAVVESLPFQYRRNEATGSRR